MTLGKCVTSSCNGSGINSVTRYVTNVNGDDCSNSILMYVTNDYFNGVDDNSETIYITSDNTSSNERRLSFMNVTQF